VATSTVTSDLGGMPADMSSQTMSPGVGQARAAGATTIPTASHARKNTNRGGFHFVSIKRNS
jgi:hypothetical protein